MSMKPRLHECFKPYRDKNGKFKLHDCSGKSPLLGYNVVVAYTCAGGKDNEVVMEIRSFIPFKDAVGAFEAALITTECHGLESIPRTAIDWIHVEPVFKEE